MSSFESRCRSTARSTRDAIIVAAFVAALPGCSGPSDGSADEASATGVEPGENLPGGDTTNTLLFGNKAFTLVAENATREHKSLFFAGNSFFNSAWVEAPASASARDGLGPLFNARSCSGCHFEDGRGRPPLEPGETFSSGMLLRIGTGERDASGAPQDDPVYGGQIQPGAIDGVPGEATPRVSYESLTGSYADGEPYELSNPTYVIEDAAYGVLSDALALSPRVAPQMVGLGLLEAIPEARLSELADPEDADGNGISGKPNRVWDAAEGAFVVGRFGWKAEQPSVHQQSSGAFLGDMGITSSIFPLQDCTEEQVACRSAANGGEPEASDEVMDAVAAYARLLAVPARARWSDATVLRGKALFASSGCDGCHTPKHRTGPSSLTELEHQEIWPYTDLLLHDMGEALSDRRPAFAAEGSEWRTPPLWGIGRIPSVNGHDRLLHDGRARGIAEAILWHGGEGEAARDAFSSLSAADRAALIDFVASL